MRRAILTLTLALGITACGGEDRMSKEDYQAELRKICTESERKTDDVAEPTRATPEAIADYLQRLRDINADAIKKFEGLEPPEDLQGPHDRALTANREGREKVDAVIEELQGGGDPTQVLTEARRELEESSRSAKDAAQDLGVRECAR